MKGNKGRKKEEIDMPKEELESLKRLIERRRPLLEAIGRL